MKSCLILTASLVFAATSACESAPRIEPGFPVADGDIEKGKQACLSLKCNACHKAEGVKLPPPNAFNRTLGGETARVKTYGEMVTSIINPSHVSSGKFQQELTAAKESPMPKSKHVITVEQMIDLGAFLQSHYTLPEPVHEPKPYHYP